MLFFALSLAAVIYVIVFFCLCYFVVIDYTSWLLLLVSFLSFIIWSSFFDGFIIFFFVNFCYCLRFGKEIEELFVITNKLVSSVKPPLELGGGDGGAVNVVIVGFLVLFFI